MWGDEGTRGDKGRGGVKSATEVGETRWPDDVSNVVAEAFIWANGFLAVRRLQ